MATNTLVTVLDQSSGRALVEKYLEEKFLERRDYDTPLANSSFARAFRIPDKSGQYVEATRKNRFRMPQKLSNSDRTSDPASGAGMGVVKLTLPMEYIQEYTGLGTVATWTSWIDLDEWAEDDLVMALQRRFHQLTQNAFKVGRFSPGVWDTDGTAATAFDTTAEATVTIDNISFTFLKPPSYFANGKGQFSELEPGDLPRMRDFRKMRVALANAGAPKINGKYVAVLSEAMATDLSDSDRYFRTAVDAWKGEGMRAGHLVDYDGWHWMIDDEPFTEDFGSALVRAANGQIHTACCFGAGAFNYVKLGSKSRLRPKFKIQDISKTGVEKTVGYMVPFQVGVVQDDWCMTYSGPVSQYEPNNA